MDYNKEIKEIKNIINSALLMDIVKREVSDLKMAMVTSGSLADRPEYDIVVKHKSGKKGNEEIGRRLKSHIKNINVDNVIENMVGVKIRKDKNAKNNKKNS